MKKILIIDDQVAGIFVEILSAKGFDAVGVTRGTEALDWLKNHNADLIILDLALPEMSGMRVAEKVKEMGIKTKIIFITGYFDKFDLEWAEEIREKYHSTDCQIFQKPFKAQEFVDLVEGNL